MRHCDISTSSSSLSRVCLSSSANCASCVSGSSALRTSTRAASHSPLGNATATSVRESKHGSGYGSGPTTASSASLFDWSVARIFRRATINRGPRMPTSATSAGSFICPARQRGRRERTARRAHAAAHLCQHELRRTEELHLRRTQER